MRDKSVAFSCFSDYRIVQKRVPIRLTIVLFLFIFYSGLLHVNDDFVDVDVDEIRAQTLSLCPFLTYNLQYYYYQKLSNCNFTAVSGSVNLSNRLIFPEVIK